MIFKKYNNNPLGLKTCDCAIRAVASGLDIDWFSASELLYESGRRQCDSPVSKRALKDVLKDFEFVTPKVIKGMKRPKVKDFSTGKYILRLAGHLTYVNDGVVYDLWDCRDKAVYCFWRIS